MHGQPAVNDGIISELKPCQLVNAMQPPQRGKAKPGCMHEHVPDADEALLSILHNSNQQHILAARDASMTPGKTLGTLQTVHQRHTTESLQWSALQCLLQRRS